MGEGCAIRDSEGNVERHLLCLSTRIDHDAVVLLNQLPIVLFVCCWLARYNDVRAMFASCFHPSPINSRVRVVWILPVQRNAGLR